MIQIRPIVFTLGIVLCAIAAVMLLPAVVDLLDGRQSWMVFALSSAFTLFIGGLMLLVTYDEAPMTSSLKDGFVLTTVSWVMVALFASIPFIGLGLKSADAVFESMSGLTTTGATVLVQLDDLPRGLLLWRSLLQGLGGLGIVVTALIVLPFLRVGGMQLFHTESSERSEKVLPRALELVTATATIYLALLVACMTLYLVFGMTPFDAVNHALTTVATGGFSTHDASFGFFPSPTLQWVCIVFMFLGSLPFVVFIRSLRGEPTAIVADEQVRGYVIFLFAVCLVCTFWIASSRDISILGAARIATFNIVSIVSTTGYATEDYTLWGTSAMGLFFLLMFVGGCSGSTSGGIKIYRLQIAGILSRSHFLHLMSPNRVVTLIYNARRVPADVPFSVVAFLAIYFATVGFYTLVLTGIGLDLVTGLSAAASAVGNVGPGLGDTIGPAGNYSGLPDSAKWVLASAMLLGRLELFTVLVLLRPEFWRG